MSDSFERKMDKIKDFLFDVMKPCITEFLQLYNKEGIEKWERNCCRQTSLITNWYLRQWLLNNSSGYLEIQSWEGVFSDKVMGRSVTYDHAWIYCVHPDPTKNLLIDIARNHKPLLFLYTPVNQYSCHISGYEQMRCIEKNRLNEVVYWNKPEHFTHKKIIEIIPLLTKYMRKQGVMYSIKKQPV